MRTPIRWCIQWSLILFFLIAAVSVFYFYLSLNYDLTQVAKMPERSIILDRNGKEFSTIHGARRRLVRRDEIPDTLVKALRAREDLRFPEHHGVDIKGLARAMLRNIKDGSFTQGASTLTMQLTRNSFNLRAKSLHRKLLEIAVTLRIEARYSKDEILTHYLNRIYFGSGCHGIEEAAQTYFGHTTSELSTGECATLVGIIRGPHLFSPFRNLKGALIQRDEVLSRMVKCGFLTEQEAKQAQQDPIHLVPKQDRHKGSSYIKESIRKQLNIILDRQGIKNGGLIVYSTLDSHLQRLCEKKINPHNAPNYQAAIVQLDPKTGGILALCGGRDFQKSPFNRVWRAKRDLGPAFAPLLHALALERGKLPLKGSPLQTGRQLGVKETIRLCKRLGFSGPFSQTEDLYRGALSASAMDLAIASSTLTNRGKKPQPYIIQKITDAQGHLLYTYTPQLSQAIGPHNAQDTLDAYPRLSSILGRVTTSPSCRDVWGIRCLPTSTTVLWMGYDQPRRLGEAKELIQKGEALLRETFLKD